MKNTNYSRLALCVMLVSALSELRAAPPRIDLPPIDIVGTSTGQRNGSPRNPIGERDGMETPAERAATAAKAAADKAAAEAAARERATQAEKDKLKAFAKEIALEVISDLSKTLGGPVLWLFWEAGTRLLDPTDIGAHPMESGKLQVDQAALRLLREELDAEASRSRKEYERKAPGKLMPESTRSLSPNETAIIAVSTQVSIDAASVAENILRYSATSTGRGTRPFGEEAVSTFIATSKPRIANSCWGKREKVARTIAYAPIGEQCVAYDRNGRKSKQPGITTLRPFGNSCSVEWGNCPIAVKEVVGTPCGCFGPTRPGYGTVVLLPISMK